MGGQNTTEESPICLSPDLDLKVASLTPNTKSTKKVTPSSLLPTASIPEKSKNRPSLSTASLPEKSKTPNIEVSPLQAWNLPIALSSFLMGEIPKEEEIDVGLTFEDLSLVNAVDDKGKPKGWNFAPGLDPQQILQATSILESFPGLWTGIGCLNTGETLKMPIKDKFKNQDYINLGYQMSKNKQLAYNAIMKELES